MVLYTVGVDRCARNGAAVGSNLTSSVLVDREGVPEHGSYYRRG